MKTSGFLQTQGQVDYSCLDSSIQRRIIPQMAPDWSCSLWNCSVPPLINNNKPTFSRSQPLVGKYFPFQAASWKTHHALPEDACLWDQQEVNKTHSWIKYCPRRTCWQKHTWCSEVFFEQARKRMTANCFIRIVFQLQKKHNRNLKISANWIQERASTPLQCTAISLKFWNKGIFFPAGPVFHGRFFLPLGFTWKLENENQTQWPKGDEACLFSPLYFSAHA